MGSSRRTTRLRQAATAVPRRGGRFGRGALVLAAAAAVIAIRPGPAAGQWRQFRGDGTSVSDQRGLPEEFDAETGRHVAWKRRLPGKGPSSPIIVDGRVIVTASSGPRQDRLHVLCFDAETGATRFRRRLWATGHTTCHPFGGVASPTPASDGRRVFAFYSSNDLACFDLEGNLLWFRGLAYENPTTRNDVGMASSPLVTGPTVIVQCENQGESFAAGIDAATGTTRWRVPRDRDAIWASPTLLPAERPEESLVLLVGRGKLSALRAQTGAPVWEYEASCHTIASPTVHDGTLYLQAHGLHALRYDAARGGVERRWSQRGLRSGNASPVVHAGRAYVVKPPGILVCGDAGTGEVLWRMRLEGPFWATPVAADGKLYCVSHPGLVQIVRLGDQGEAIAACRIDEGILASPAVADGAIYFRSDAHLWKMEAPGAADRAAPPAAGAQEGSEPPRD